MDFKNRFSKSSNPLFSEKMTEKLEADAVTGIDHGVMTVSGAVNKSFILLGILLASSVIGFTFASPIVTMGSGIIGLVLVFVASFKPSRSVWAAPSYAFFEGLFVGGVSFFYASAFNGLIFQAVALTMAIFFMMLFIYKAQIIKVTEKFRSAIIMATGAIFLVYILNFALSFFGINMPYLHEGGLIGIGISLFIIAIAALNLLLDFDFIERGTQSKYPEYMEWFAGLGLLVTIVWLYVEVLRLLAILSSND